jgi:hypothetical protein
VKKVFYLLLIIGFSNHLTAQEITGVVKGSVIDRATGSPLEGVNIRLEGLTSTTQSNQQGKFSFEIPVGRYKITATSTGYTAYTQEILVSAGKTLIINFSLDPSMEELQTVEVYSSPMSEEVAGQRSLTIEKTFRIPANYLDPVRAITAYPGVVTANDQGNSIIVRGNSPNGLIWKLNGADIVNPNHLSNAGTFSDKPMANGGGVNIISAQIIDKTDFYTGQVPVAYGNSLSGVIDMTLREGNKEKMEYTAQASLLGLDVAAEGPLGKNETTSFLANYRYSTVGLLSAMGVDFGDESIAFQDLAFHLNHRARKGMNLSVFGFWGDSRNDFDAKASDEWEQEKDQYTINYKSRTGAIGGNMTLPLGRGKLSAALAYSRTTQSRDSEISSEAYSSPAFVKVDDYDQVNGLFSSRLDYFLQFTSNFSWTTGISANEVNNEVLAVKVRSYFTNQLQEEDILYGRNYGMLIQPYTSLKLNFSSKVSFDAGVRYVNYTYNATDAIEPRATLSVKPNERSFLTASYGLISQIQIAQMYAVNPNLDLTKSHHFDIAHTQMFSNDLELRTGLYYQSLFDVPIASRGYQFSALNFLEGLPPDSLVSGGTGTNYGVDATLEKQFFAKHYILIGASYYKSTYVPRDGLERNTRFDGNYTFSAVHGKEWTKETKRRTIGVNTRVLYLGGMNQSRVWEGESVRVGETIYNDANPYSEKLGDYFRLDLRVSFRKNKPGYTRTFAIDIQNLTNQQNDAYQYYDRLQAKTVMKYHLGIIPLLVYRIDF